MNNMYEILDKMKLLEDKAAKPDFLDLDKDGDRTEPMKKAAKEKKVDEAVEEVAESDIDESALQAYLGKKKYGEAGMKALQQAGREGASKDKMAAIRARHDKMDEADMDEGNDFTGARLAAIKAGKPTFSVGGKTFRVTGDTSDEKMMEKKEKTLWPGTPAYKAKFGDEMRTGEKKRSSTGGEIEKTDTGVRHTKSYDDDEEGDDAKADDGAPKRRGRPKGSKRAIGAKVKGTSKLHSKPAIKEADLEIEIPGSDRMSDDDRHRAIMKKYPGAKKTGKTPGEYTLPDGTKLVSGIRGVRKVDEDYDQDEYDEEGEMAKSQSRTIADAAKELQHILDDNENLPEWVQKKITLAQEYIDSARDYLKANRPDQDGEEEMMPERELTKPEMAKREKYVKSMKKSKGDFEKRYGDQGEEVMYATATKMAKKKAEESKDDKEEEIEETTVSGAVATADEAPKSKSKKGMIFGKGVYEGYEEKYKRLLTEGMSINMSVGEDGTKSLNVNATDEDAVKLAQILQLAGMPHGEQYHAHSQMEEAEYANSPEQETADINTLVNTYSDGLDGQKTTGQTTIPVVAGQTQRMMSQVREQAEQRLWDLYKRYESK